RLRAVLDRLGGRRRGVPVMAEVPPDRVAAGSGVSVRGLSVSFGGLTAVENLSFDAPLGRITGLIGPNGAGKTTTFNACSGLNRRYTGEVKLRGRSIDRLSPASRARSGLGRTFQRMELGDTLSVYENVALGCEASQAGARPTRQLFARPAERRRTAEAT